jgi:hypothetical protein
VSAPIFSGEEISRLMQVRKHVEHEAKSKGLRNREGKFRKYKAASDDLPNVEFYVEFERTIAGCHCTLSVKMNDARPEQAIVRYDIQMPAHENPDSSIMQPKTPHRHIYTPEMVVKFGSWDRIAEAVVLSKDACENLWSKFLVDLQIHFSDTDTQLFSQSEMR